MHRGAILQAQSRVFWACVSKHIDCDVGDAFPIVLLGMNDALGELLLLQICQAEAPYDIIVLPGINSDKYLIP